VSAIVTEHVKIKQNMNLMTTDQEKQNNEQNDENIIDKSESKSELNANAE